MNTLSSRRNIEGGVMRQTGFVITVSWQGAEKQGSGDFSGWSTLGESTTYLAGK
jgi:hypothetical protein